MNTGVDAISYWPMAIYVIGVLAIVGLMLGLSYLLGQRHKERATDEVYESGILITGSARVRFSVKFYLIAMFFVIFDLEAVYLIAWATAAKEVGWAGYFEALVFVVVLVVALVYLWRSGGLNFGTDFRREQQSKHSP